MKKYLWVCIVCTISFLGCNKVEDVKTIPTGSWRAELLTQGQSLPFNFNISKNKNDKLLVELLNGKEKLHAGIIKFENDSIVIPLGFFDASLKASWKNDILEGVFIKHFADNYQIPFRAYPSKYGRYETLKTSNSNIFNGKWEVDFHITDENRSYPALGVFNYEDKTYNGTFLTLSGDYRFLEGAVLNDTLKLSTFDGEHAYLFKAWLTGKDSISGEYYSGKGGFKTWTGVRNDSAQLESETPLTYLKEGIDQLGFKLPNIKGDSISLSDDKYKNKLVIVQLLGTWCSNCMDETNFLNEWYSQNKDRGVEIIGLAYENKADFDYGKVRIEKMVKRLNVQYDILVAGSRIPKYANATLPMLNAVKIFPTTIFIDKSGKVKKIHSGFSGPGTGKYYDIYKKNFNDLINQILSEDIAD